MFTMKLMNKPWEKIPSQTVKWEKVISAAMLMMLLTKWRQNIHAPLIEK